MLFGGQVNINNSLSFTGVLSQTTTLDLLPMDPNEPIPAQGKAIGTGADGTTVEISGTILGAPFTGTLFSAG